MRSCHTFNSICFAGDGEVGYELDWEQILG